VRELEHRFAMARGPVGVAEPPEDGRDQRVSVVEAGQLVLGQGRKRLVGEIVRGGDIAVGMECEIREKDERTTFDVG
jgi:hypothetical protein